MFCLKSSKFFLFCLIAGMGLSSKPGHAAQRLYDFKVKSIDNEDISLEKYRGMVVLIVNTASKCGYTSQYEGLQSLYQKYQSKGFVILGFPSNDFGNQEPGTASDIKSFCKANFGVTFPLFAKASVRGNNKQELFKWLTNGGGQKDLQGEVSWNFQKFLIDRSGRLTARFASGKEPLSSEVTKAVEDLLNSPREN